MDAAAILDLYDAECRVDPPPEIGVERVWVDGVQRSLGAYNFIGWWRFGAGRAAEIAAREAAYFGALGVETEWKVHGHDGPPGLEAALAKAGWRAEEPETFMVLDLSEQALDPAPPPGVEVRRVIDRAGLDDLVTANTLAFGSYAAWQVEALPPRLSDPTLGLYVAYFDGAPVCSGRLELAPGRAIARLFGGGTAPEYRGRGIYRALVAARAAEAILQGHRFLAVDARETSRPILTRLGFQPLTTIRDWLLNPRSGA